MDTTTISAGGLVSLASNRGDLPTGLGTPPPTTPAGFEALEGGGLRSGTLLPISGEDGGGETGHALLIACMAGGTLPLTFVARASVFETRNA